MPAGKMHDDEIEIDASLVRRLLAAQFPLWADLPITPVASAGTDHALYRLGEELVARLPRIEWATKQMGKEFAWLPRLAPHLPLPIPTPLAKGAPGEGYPWGWSIYRWLAGEDATLAPIADLHHLARDVANFIAALRRIDPAGGPPSHRGVPLATRDAQTRAAIVALDNLPSLGLDTVAITTAWDASLRVQAWNGPSVWIHGDLQPLNLLVQRGRLSAVIDWGGLGVGDPAGDLMAAWTLLSADTRPALRAALPMNDATDDATWARGRGCALSWGLIALPYYHQTNPALARIARRAIDEALTDYQTGG